MNEKDKWYDCACGIFVKGKKFLVEKRRDDEDIDPSYVCFPSGHVDEGETIEEALRREMKEELGIDIGEFEKITTLKYIASNDEKELLHYFLVSNWKGKINSTEADYENGLSEHEYDHVFVGRYEGKIRPNPKEVSEYRWISLKNLEKEFENNGKAYAPWLKIAYKELIKRI